MYYELRTYTLKPTKLGDWLALYKSAALPVQEEYLGNLIGFFSTEFGEANQVVHIWAYASLDDRIARRTAMAADPRWQAFSRQNKELDAIVSLHSKLLRPTDFSPLK
ncbi:NIPSNAP protein [Pseudomonas taetrolens]|uniref:NIPSNAP family containing protein n=1 Tax=Pseudomonas taetrolens TaxID=47884 RepID=A0A0J6JP15_PSETA|nr:NIPSNAP family protein [Pseudomonas taetrolens]KMM85552.1 NIPSNAP family containing protein [Pseudomonas taetrolens]SEC22176.1 NIPSNAP protein [Pseudomonas taetrolens]SQF86173.1 NIPSNAP family containing protein [Pseudomonas taetrolens]VEH49249.1 NIPSNAP family containing protein [Pseudomonas taetrolens]